MRAGGAARALRRAGIALAQVTADAVLAALVVLVAGALLCLAWYVAIEGAPPLRPVLHAWDADAPIPLSLFLPPALTVLAAIGAGAIRFIAAAWEAMLGGTSLRFLPYLQRCWAGRQFT